MCESQSQLERSADTIFISCHVGAQQLEMQVDEEAPIRANTTILLGNLAEHLSEATCKRVLLNAFTRALKDTFPPARTAGLKVDLLSSFVTFSQPLR